MADYCWVEGKMAEDCGTQNGRRFWDTKWPTLVNHKMGGHGATQIG